MTISASRDTATHPLALLTGDEIVAAVAAARAAHAIDDGDRIVHVRLHEPEKAEVIRHRRGDPVVREVEILAVPGPDLTLVQVRVALPDGVVVERRTIEGQRPALLFGECFEAMLALRENPDWCAALARRGITDPDQVQIDPWPAGSFGVPHENGRRIARCLAYRRETPTTNGYAHPLEGLVAFVDLGAKQVLEVVDAAGPPIPDEPAGYRDGDAGPTRTDLKALEIVQPDGPSFVVEGNLVRWQRWSLRVGFDPYEGLVLHTVGYEDGGRVRPILHRASVTEMVVPYGDPSPSQAWKNAFDAGEWGLGRMTNSLSLGCDCLGEIHYFDATLANERGEPQVISNAICMHEEDFGILWKHHDLHGGTSEVRRSRRLVISFIATVGNYDYGFYWYLYQDGNIQLEVKLTGIIQPAAVAPGVVPVFGNLVAPGIASPHHQHLFNARLDFDVDGPTNTVYEVDAVAVPLGPDNPYGNAFVPRARKLERELGARSTVDSASSRYWQIVNPHSTNRLGEPVAYRLLPTMSTPTLLADESSSVARRAGFTRYNLWVTPYAPDEQRAAGDFPNQHEGGDGLPRWTAADRSIADTDVVCWYTFGVTHFARPEDWPVMPVEYTGFLLSPAGFFDRNPALDLPSSAGHCHPGGAGKPGDAGVPCGS